MDIFRVFDSLNDIEQMRLGIDAVGSAGGVVSAAICYTGDVSNPQRDSRYTLDYFLEYAAQLEACGVHFLTIKDMAGLLKPEAARLLVGGLRAEFPHIPIQVHTHDTAGTGVASMLAAAAAGADSIDCCFDAVAGLTSQPSIGAIAACSDAHFEPAQLEELNVYWEQVRGLYAPFESGQKSGSADVYQNEIPGGQYTNLLFQAKQLNLGDRWPQIKRAYAAANRVLGDIPKVTPSSKVVGDLAQFMVANDDMSEETLRAKLRAGEALSLPGSVVEYFEGQLGTPPGGFDAEVRAAILAGAGQTPLVGRPGASAAPFDFPGARAELEANWPERTFRDVDVTSYALYPSVFREWVQFKEEFGRLAILPTRVFLEPMVVGEEVTVEIEHGKVLYLKLVTMSEPDFDGMRSCVFEVNGDSRAVQVRDEAVGADKSAREVADPLAEGSVGAPMPGVVVEVSVEVGDDVVKGDTLFKLSAMKMETSVASPASGRVQRVIAAQGDNVSVGDLLVDIDC